ncbi:MAG: MFS transporter, partial [Planctomycetes bacterium]|nr:MFS transporter [Planctomycetota bacterium]
MSAGEPARTAATPAPAGEAPRPRFPPGIPYIIGNEAAERFSYYGMRAILFVYMTALYLDFAPKAGLDPAAVKAAETKATQVVHTFMAGVYAFPMIGAILADRLLGKYTVIFWVSLIYCAGHAMLAFAGRHEWGMYVGLALIAVGSGGIKPCVSANVGDQFTAANARLVPAVYQIFYFSINFGSFFATLLIPFVYKTAGPEIAFGIPGILMGIATLIFWLGRNKFVRVPPRPGGKLGLVDFLASVYLFLPFAIFAFGPSGYYG